LNGTHDPYAPSRMRASNPMVYILKDEFQSLLSSPQRVDVCEWVAKCFYQLEQFDEAGSWYETAGQLILAEPSTPAPIKAMSALPEYERALDCYLRSDDTDSFTECSTMIRQLKRACASA
jgi:tetratricopeptide (TPR) repeat protein